jgi:Thioesterase-like superfamily
VVQACNLIQGVTTQPDPLHVSTQFIAGSTPGPCIITIRRIKEGRNYCNLTAELSQAVCLILYLLQILRTRQGKANLHCQLIYGILSVAKHPFGPFPSGPSYLTHQHPHALSRRCPIATHPSKCIAAPFKRPYAFAKHILQAVDPYYATLLESRGHGYAVTNPVDLGGGGSVWAAWFQMKDAEDIASTPLVAFLADISPDLLPEFLLKQRGPMYVVLLSVMPVYADYSSNETRHLSASGGYLHSPSAWTSSTAFQRIQLQGLPHARLVSSSHRNS